MFVMEGDGIIMKLHFHQNQTDNTICVKGVAPCGDKFTDIAIIYEIDSSDPVLYLPKPLGVNAVNKILNYIKNYHKE